MKSTLITVMVSEIQSLKSFTPYLVLTRCDKNAPWVQGVLQVRFTRVLVRQATLHIAREKGSVCSTTCAGCTTAWPATHATRVRHTRRVLVGCLQHNGISSNDVTGIKKSQEPKATQHLRHGSRKAFASKVNAHIYFYSRT